MGRGVADNLRILAFDPTSNGFAYAVLEGKERLIDYGHVTVPPTPGSLFLTKVAALFTRFEPELVVVENPSKTSRRERGKRRIKAIVKASRVEGVPVQLVTRSEVRRVLGWRGDTKHRIAMSVTRRFPEMLRLLPPERGREPEAERMNIFDAISFALTVLDQLAGRGLSD